MQINCNTILQYYFAWIAFTYFFLGNDFTALTSISNILLEHLGTVFLDDLPGKNHSVVFRPDRAAIRPFGG